MKIQSKPTFYLNVWEGSEGEFLSRALSNQEYMYWFHAIDGATEYQFDGKAARVRILTASSNLTRELALKTATFYMQGKYLRVDFDLNDLTIRVTKGTIPINPPY